MLSPQFQLAMLFRGGADFEQDGAARLEAVDLARAIEEENTERESSLFSFCFAARENEKENKNMHSRYVQAKTQCRYCTHPESHPIHDPLSTKWTIEHHEFESMQSRLCPSCGELVFLCICAKS